MVLWEATHGERSRGTLARAYADQLIDDTDLENEQVVIAMKNRKYWKEMFL